MVHTITNRVLVGYAVATASPRIAHPMLRTMRGVFLRHDHAAGALGGGIYTFDRMAQASAPGHSSDMHRTLGSHRSKRPADNELYDRGCDLVEAATSG
jgi:hypothetical protein